MPRVSVILPVHKGRETVKACLQALGASSFKDYEIIVIIDGPCDVDPEFIRGYTQKIVVLPERQGRSFARNEGVKIAQGGIIVFVDSDIMVRPDTLLKSVEFLDAHPHLLPSPFQRPPVGPVVEIDPAGALDGRAAVFHHAPAPARHVQPGAEGIGAGVRRDGAGPGLPAARRHADLLAFAARGPARDDRLAEPGVPPVAALAALAVAGGEQFPLDNAGIARRLDVRGAARAEHHGKCHNIW